MSLLWGIDFGKKFSGNTVICYRSGSRVGFYQAEKNRDADRFILEKIKSQQPDYIFIDAPLSLPGAFHDPASYNDYFFRRCDQQLGAMSPMFLGGMTARAIRLKNEITAWGIEFRETYPKALALQLKLKDCGYRRGKENIGLCCDRIMESSNLVFDKKPIVSWHHLDALLAMISAIRYEQKLSLTFGDKSEGTIHI